MKNTRVFAYAQGACVSQTSYALILLAISSRFRLSLTSLKSCLGLLFLLLTASTTLAQYDTIVVESSQIKYSFDKEVVNSGEWVEVSVHLGTATSPVERASGFEMGVELGEATLYLEEEKANTENSWLLDPKVDAVHAALSPTGNALTFSGVRSNGQKLNDQGEIFRFRLLNLEEERPAAALLPHIGGSTIVVENVDLKKPWEEESLQHTPLNLPTSTPILYPNPCEDILTLNWQENLPESVQVWNSSGALVANLETESIQMGVYDTRGMSSGMYVFSMHYAFGEIKTLRVMIK